jgi:hypothetical protein
VFIPFARKYENFTEENMKKLLGGIAILGLLAFLLGGALAQTAHASALGRTATQMYDASKEITLEGSVSSIHSALPGKAPGTHLLVATSKGTVDGLLGPYALLGSNRVSVAAGTHVKMVGVMANVHGNQVFLVRTIDTGSHVYTIRSAHGFPLLPDAVQPTKNINFVAPKGDRQ